MIIGFFSLSDDRSGYRGGIKAIGFDGPVWLEPVATKTPRGPDYVLISHQHTEIGAAWKRTGKDGAYVSVKLDSPFLPEPLHCALIGQADGTHALVWHREKPGRKTSAAEAAQAG